MPLQFAKLSVPGTDAFLYGIFISHQYESRYYQSDSGPLNSVPT